MMSRKDDYMAWLQQEIQASEGRRANASYDFFFHDGYTLALEQALEHYIHTLAGGKR